MNDICQELAELLTYDPGGRLIPSLSSREPIEQAVSGLLRAKRVMLISGFYIGKANAWETDGPLGTLVLAEALERARVNVCLATDHGCRAMLEYGARCLNLKAKVLGFPHGQAVSAEILDVYQSDVLVAIERTGAAADGHYYNASGYDISQQVAHFDELFVAARARGLQTIAVGDGGNELGFGGRLLEARALLDEKAAVACVTAADQLVPCGVSNWGGYALAAAFLRKRGMSSAIDEPLLVKVLQEIVAAGAIDGVTLQRAATVDGLPLCEEQDMFRLVMRFAEGATKTAD